MQERFLPHDHGQQIEHQLDAMPKEEDFQIVSDLFKLLCDRSRVRIFLRQLKNSGLIVSRREGKEVYYRAADTEQAQLLHHMIEKMVEIACPDA